MNTKGVTNESWRKTISMFMWIFFISSAVMFLIQGFEFGRWNQAIIPGLVSVVSGVLIYIDWYRKKNGLPMME